jgi:hypothetical protein
MREAVQVVADVPVCHRVLDQAKHAPPGLLAQGEPGDLRRAEPWKSSAGGVWSVNRLCGFTSRRLSCCRSVTLPVRKGARDFTSLRAPTVTARLAGEAAGGRRI